LFGNLPPPVDFLKKRKSKDMSVSQSSEDKSPRNAVSSADSVSSLSDKEVSASLSSKKKDYRAKKEKEKAEPPASDPHSSLTQEKAVTQKDSTAETKKQ
jgi:hypothetical protein